MKRLPRVLHLLHKFDVGGIERWLLDVATAGVPGWEMEFAVEAAQPGTLQDQVLQSGCPVHFVGKGNGLELRRVLRRRGIDAVHSHVHAFSGFVLGVAKLAGVPVRIAHSHCCEHARDRFGRRTYFAAMRQAIGKIATARLAVSRQAGIALFDAMPFHFVPPARRFAAVKPRRGTGKRLVVGHVGRNVPIKNHQLLQAIAARMQCELLLSTETTPEEVYAAADVFVLPSISEGLGLAAVEAQAAGLPCVISDGVPQEACVIPDLVKRVRLSESLDTWCGAIETAARMGRRADAMAWIAKSPFSLDFNIAKLAEIYAGA